VAAVQYTFTHKQYTEYRKRNIHNNKKNKFGKCGQCPVFASYVLAFALQLRKTHGKPSVRVAVKCPDIPVAAVQYTFTHKQYTEQHNQTEYTEQRGQNTQNRKININLLGIFEKTLRMIY
jgi:negative regulator of sigma E activity